MYKIRCVYLHINSWTGISIGAEHYYGSLEPDWSDETDHALDYKARKAAKFELQRPLSTKEARYLNKKDGAIVGFGRHKKGDLTDRFDSEEDLWNAARSCWRKIFPQGQLLIGGTGGTCQPVPVLDGDEPFFTKAKAVWARFEVFWDHRGGWERKANEPSMDRLCKQWDKLLGGPRRK